MPTLFHNPNTDRSHRWLIEDAEDSWYLLQSDIEDFDPEYQHWSTDSYTKPMAGYGHVAHLSVDEANALCEIFHVDANEKDLEAWIRENHPAGFQTDKTITVETEPSAAILTTEDPSMCVSFGLKAERIPRFGETCDEITANLAPHSREMRVLILETLLRIERGEVKP